VYAGQHEFKGDFVMPVLTELPRANANSRIKLGRASVVLGVADVRGIRNIPAINWNGVKFEFKQGSEISALDTGLHADIHPVSLEQPASVAFSMSLGLDGIERQSFVPLGKNNKVSVKSPWPHPQFAGEFLPSARDRTINDSGFAAKWEVLSLSTTVQKQIRDREDVQAQNVPRAGLESFSVAFIEPVNVYSLAERATKYGLLSIALTFAAFFMFEIIKRLPIHPVQYLLVGLALVMFFLLLVSLSEHIDFAVAYLIASAACISLLGFYLSYVLRNWRRGVGFAAALTALYGALYGLLISENNALVLGSILLFAMLAAVMVATRKIDWYNIGKPDEAPARFVAG
jgi:inner membrane protein